MRFAMNSFADELEKVGKRTAVQLLSSLAAKKGFDPARLGAIRQVGNVAESGNRGRAAEIAQNLRGFLKSSPAKAAA